MNRTGIGYDVHQLAAGRRLVIGGVVVPAEFGSVGHSDGDVLIHAIVDALLGAAALGDIGALFPSTDRQWKDADSRIFLRKAAEMLRSAGYAIVNIDSIVVLQEPKLRDFIQPMRRVLSDVLEVNIDAIAVKATTTDHLGFIGEGRGLAALATVTISRE